MTGLKTGIKDVVRSKNVLINGVLSETAWNAATLTYAFPTTSSSYAYNNDPNENFGEPDNNFGAISVKQQNAALFVMEQSFGNSANDGFSVEGFTKLAFTKGSASTAVLRFAESDAAAPTAHAYFPARTVTAGDIWFSTTAAEDSSGYRNAVAGNYEWHTLIHELGHALGLKHGHEGNTFGALPNASDSVEFSVMTYTSFVGGDQSGYTYEEFGAPQTFMMADIAALQHLYGADFSTKSGDTVYKWTPDSGKTLIDGEVGINPGANRIFATLWDGGGKDTFDLTAYKTALSIDLRPGHSSLFSKVQTVYLDGGPNDGHARGNIFNALLYNGDTRSLIENAKGGSGNDKIVGNQVANVLTGNSGNDKLYGEAGNDTLYGSSGNDVLCGGTGADRLSGGSGADKFLFRTISESTALASGRDTITDFIAKDGDRIDLSGIDANSKLAGDQAFTFIGSKAFSGAYGELRCVKSGTETYVYADVNHDKTADFAIRFDDVISFQKDFFIL